MPALASAHVSPRRGVFFALLGALCSACFLIPWKLAQHHGDAKHATLVLLASAALFSTLTVQLGPSSSTLGPREQPPVALGLTLKLAAALAALSLAGNWLSAESVARISGALLAVMQRCEVLVVGLLSPLVLGERARPSFWVGTAIAAVGLVLLSSPSGAALRLGEDADPLGAIFGVGSAICFGSMSVLTRKHIRVLRPVLLNAVRLWLGVVLWFAIERSWPLAALTGPLVLYAAMAAFFGPFLSRLAAMESAQHVAASTTVLASLVTPPLTLVLSFAVLGTLPSGHELVGGAIMLVGVAIPVLATLRSS
jgi:drug/metabolite transporter (DMT)-like permease